MSNTTITPEDRADAAMCAWEWMIEVRSNNPHVRAPSGFTCWFSQVGTAEARVTCFTDLSEAIHWAWEAAREAGFDDCFDWEFVPWFMTECVEWSSLGADVVPDYLERAKRHGEAFEQKLQRWLGERRT